AGAPADEKLIEEAKSVLIQVLYSDAVQEAGGSIAKNKLVPPVLSVIKDNPNKKKLTEIIFKDDFLTLQDGWTYEKGVISVA
ncbi:MAG: hypothetical protein WC291_11415, partial [Thermodesulfovibrionales bacterium]